MKTLFLVRGVPGSGKSTLVKSLDAYAVAADDYHTDADGNYNWKPENSKAGHEWCQNRVREIMETCDETICSDIAVHNTFTQAWKMQPYFALAAEYGYRVTTLIVENRHGSKSIHNVPSETIKKMTDRFEVVLAPEVKYEDYVQIKERNGLFIHKYKKSVFYGNLWNIHPDLIHARGLITDAGGNIIQYPFTKIFNYRENNTEIDKDNIVLSVDKINGFMCAVTWHDGKPLVSTTGSLTSDFVDMATKMLPLDRMAKDLQQYSSYTFCFEIVHPNDPHIIPEEIGAYLIGARLKCYESPQVRQGWLDDFAFDWGVYRPVYEYNTFSRILDKLKTYKREGFVVYDTVSNTVLKLKSPYYLVSKFIARTKKLHLIFDRNYKQHFEEEFYSLCEFLQETYTPEQFSEIPEQERLAIVRDWAENAYV